MSNATSFTDASFDQEVLKSETPVLVDFSAEWCGPCKQLSPIIDELAGEYDGRVKIGKVDVDAAQEIAGRYAISSVPTVLLFKNGEKVDTIVGLNQKSLYKSKLDELLG